MRFIFVRFCVKHVVAIGSTRYRVKDARRCRTDEMLFTVSISFLIKRLFQLLCAFCCVMCCVCMAFGSTLHCLAKKINKLFKEILATEFTCIYVIEIFSFCISKSSKSFFDTHSNWFKTGDNDLCVCVFRAKIWARLSQNSYSGNRHRCNI